MKPTIKGLLFKLTAVLGIASLLALAGFMGSSVIGGSKIASGEADLSFNVIAEVVRVAPPLSSADRATPDVKDGDSWAAQASGWSMGRPVVIYITGITGAAAPGNTDLAVSIGGLGTIRCATVGTSSASGWCYGGSGKYVGASGTFTSLQEAPTRLDMVNSRRPQSEMDPAANPADLELRFTLAGVLP